MIDKRILQARQFVLEVRKLANEYKLPFFVVTDGASGIDNTDCEAVEHARKAHAEWELKQGINPNHDWLHNINE